MLLRAGNMPQFKSEDVSKAGGISCMWKPFLWNNDGLVSFDAVRPLTNAPKFSRWSGRFATWGLGSRITIAVNDTTLISVHASTRPTLFSGEPYHQSEGCPIPSPISVTSANLVMEKE